MKVSVVVTNPLYQMYMYLHVCVYVHVCTQISVYFRIRSSVVFIRLPRKFILVAFKLKIQNKCTVKHSPLDAVICKWTYSARKNMNIESIEVECVFVKSTEGWIWLLKTLKEHIKDGLKGEKNIYILSLKSVRTDAWFD